MLNLDNIPEAERHFYMFCEHCQQYFDRRDVSQIFDHMHDPNTLKNVASQLGIDTDEPE